MAQEADERFCDHCEGLGYTRQTDTKGKFYWEVCTCVLLRKLKNKFGLVGNFTLVGEVNTILDGIDLGNNLYLSLPFIEQKIVNGAIVYLWYRAGINKSLKIVTLLDIIDIKFGNIPECKSLNCLREDILVVEEGYSEAANKSQESWVCEMLDNRRRLGLLTWFVTINNSGICKLSKIHEYLMGHNFTYKSVKSSVCSAPPPFSGGKVAVDAKGKSDSTEMRLV